MNHHLDQFARQLASWAEELIERDRTPFRRVDVHMPISTCGGTQRIPLIFWINRQSMMAGGLIFLPPTRAEEELQQAKIAALALGLTYFVTWEKQQVRIWQIQESALIEYKTLPLTHPEKPETFYFVLQDLLETLKLTVVLGTIPGEKLEPEYFHNLCRITLEQTLPVMMTTYRTWQRDNISDSATDIDHCAEEANRLILLQLMILVQTGHLCEPLLPEQLENELIQSLEQLPEKVYQVLNLRPIHPIPGLPLEAAIAFHHFLLRLGQLFRDGADDRLRKTLSLLAEDWFPEYRTKKQTICEKINVLHPTAPPTEVTGLILSDSPSLLAITAVMKFLSHKADCPFIFGHLMSLNSDTLPAEKTFARLLNQRPVTARERNKFLIQLRISWPLRKFKLRTGQPLWQWEFIHLLGLCRKDRILNLEIPSDGLQAAADSPLWKLLTEHYRIIEIAPVKNSLRLKLIRQAQNHSLVRIYHPNGPRDIYPDENCCHFRIHLLLALHLTDPLYQLLGHELVWGNLADLTDAQRQGLKIFHGSRLFALIQALVAPPASQTPGPVQNQHAGTPWIPFPKSEILEQIQQRGRIPSPPTKSQPIDQLLAELLHCRAVETIEVPALPDPPPKTRPATKTISRELLQQIRHQLDIYGIPSFPEQYLYFIDPAQMQTFSFTPPLQIKSEILNQFSLTDASGQTIEGMGEDLKQALLFCSLAGKNQAVLPLDPNQIKYLLELYQKDLNALYLRLQTLCFSRLENPRTARKLVKKIWRQMQLPSVTTC